MIVKARGTFRSSKERSKEAARSWVSYKFLESGIAGGLGLKTVGSLQFCFRKTK